MKKMIFIYFALVSVAIFLSQPAIMQSFNENERKMLLKEALKKFDLKQHREDLFGGHNRSATIWMMARALFDENKLNITKTSKSPETVVSSLESGMLIDIDVQSIYQQAKAVSHE
ncbi:MAG: hypothetical protein LBG28_04575 [Tannerella sp.]|nr:hypothetical protein [Tannerella sp.]